LLPSLLAISVGASLGAVLRWVLANQLNTLFPSIPPGTLAANLIGGYLMGLAMAVFALHPGVPPAWRLFLVTGFLGALTTFSAFSAEVASQLMSGNALLGLATTAAHVLGSITMTLLGVGTVSLLRTIQAGGSYP
jgi:CrcB protein